VRRTTGRRLRHAIGCWRLASILCLGRCVLSVYFQGHRAESLIQYSVPYRTPPVCVFITPGVQRRAPIFRVNGERTVVDTVVSNT
jgi:hypothetical protein